MILQAGKSKNWGLSDYLIFKDLLFAKKLMMAAERVPKISDPTIWYTLPMKNQIFPHITVTQGVRFGKPVIAGTRTPVAVVIGKIAGGMTVEEVMREYNLKKEQVYAALKYAAEIVANEDIATL